MPIYNNKTIALAAILSGLVWNTAYADVQQPQGVAVEMLSTLQDDSQVSYLNAAELLVEEGTVPTLSDVRDSVLRQHQRYLIDFSNISDEQGKTQAKALLRGQLGVALSSDFWLITEHKGELLFTGLDDENDPSIQLLEAQPVTYSRQRRSIDSRTNATSEANSLPHVAFYVNVHRPISDEECTFKNSHLWDKGTRVFCDNPNISLIYRVNYERSLQFGTTGSATPDAKIVRISLDDDTTGAGIHLNDQLGWRQYAADYVTLDAYFRDWSTDAIAQDYQFVFNASNNKAQILKTFPRENINSDYEIKEVSGFQVGVNGGVEVNKDGPKAKLEANASYNQSRWLTFKTHDYKVARSTPSPQKVRFTWERDQYATAESLLNRWTDALWVNTYPIDTNKINPIGYASFVPKMDVIYSAAPTETGTTEFTIDSSVNIRPIYNGAYKHYYVFGAHQSYHGFENDGRRRVGKTTSFTVDWQHPVFTGGRPVNLQLASFNNRCVEVNGDQSITASECADNKQAQSFIYDQLGRYVSAANTAYCLDGDNLNALQQCNSSLSQRWEWIPNSDTLSNVYSHQSLGHDTTTGQLGLYASDQSNISVRTITSYTNVFNPDNQ
ncbi:leukocidin family pore-forming toxin [Vibrio metschnikovii]|uniref:leukocidin family pore-forming toxin n=1 Tax=Vibrio metschnikovii TaxID=28172 RepID=UPI0016473E1A|nr:leukocidin family pore-forming toxin [Vibrio metschnikovii]EKO3565184.1 leukocidin family pore-forming toxin [Vibrio metschnikovii]EKO3768741.1 leukocidin family pore-forming toxin [Vibrio metschnikovii]MBC3620386.1 hemolysin [Vibrio metschnikovii]